MMEGSLNQLDFEKAVWGALKGVAGRLRLDLDSNGFCDQQELKDWVQRAWSEEKHNPEALEILVYRGIGRMCYYAWRAVDTPKAEAVMEWLGSYLYRGLATKLKGDWSLAEELTNTALARIYEKFDACLQPDFFLKWASQIAVRLLLQEIRYQRPRATLYNKPDENEVVLEAAASSLEPEQSYLRREWLEEVLTKIYLLKAGKRTLYYRHILLGTYFAGSSDEELATQLNTTKLEIQRMRYQALVLLRRSMNISI